MRLPRKFRMIMAQCPRWLFALKEGEHEKHMMKLNETLQKHFPGNYIMEEYYDTTLTKFSHRPKFKSEEDKMMFILKYGE